MINQVPILNSNVRNPFSEFKTPKNGYYMVPENTAQKPKEEINKNGKKSHTLAYTIAVSALVAGFGVMALMKGFMPKGTSRNLDKLKTFLEQKVANIKNKKSVTKMEEFYIFALRKVESFTKKSESINNITSLKDILFQKLMWGKNGTRKFTRKIHEGITRFFEKISRKTVLGSYRKTHKKFNGLNDYLTTINNRLLTKDPHRIIEINGQKKPLSYWINMINARNTVVNTNLQSGFGESARKARYLFMKRSCEGMDEFFWDKSFKDIKNFKSKTMYQTFIADDYIAANKMGLGNNVGKLRQLITHDIDDNYKATKLALSNIEKYINPADHSSMNVIKQLRANLNKYKKLSGNNEVNARVKLNNEIIKDLKRLSSNYMESSAKYNYSKDAVKQISTYIADVDNIISKSSKGELQEILTIYKEILPRNEYLKLKDKVNGAIKSLDKSIDIETVQFFDKIRDLKVGSAPTDVLSIVASTGAIGYGLTKAKDNEERKSVMLKAGIPVVAALGTSLYCTACLINGGKALAVGLLSGLIMNKVGVYVDNARKKFNEKIAPKPLIETAQEPQLQPKSV